MTSQEQQIEKAKQHFGKLVEQQLKRVDAVKSSAEPVSYKNKSPIVIGFVGGDGIGPIIAKVSKNVLSALLKDDIASGKVQIKVIEGLTLENRLEAGKAIPDDVLAELKECDVILKGPTTTPEKGDGQMNIESANVRMRKELDLFANVRPISVPELGIDWTFFRENTEGLYALGSDGLVLNEDISFDFRIISTPGATRVCEAAFKFARDNDKKRVSVVTKANVVKSGDGRFLDAAKAVAKNYEKDDIKLDSWYIDIMTARLIDKTQQSEFEVMVMPNLYGDILTDEAAQIQGGVGTAGAANIGDKYAMFEAIHGSAPRMVKQGRAQYANPTSMLRASSMLLTHIERQDLATKLNRALDICGTYERKIKLTGHEDGATAEEYGKYVLKKALSPDLEREYALAKTPTPDVEQEAARITFEGKLKSYLESMSEYTLPIAMNLNETKHRYELLDAISAAITNKHWEPIGISKDDADDKLTIHFGHDEVAQ